MTLQWQVATIVHVCAAMVLFVGDVTPTFRHTTMVTGDNIQCRCVWQWLIPVRRCTMYIL